MLLSRALYWGVRVEKMLVVNSPRRKSGRPLLFFLGETGEMPLEGDVAWTRLPCGTRSISEREWTGFATTGARLWRWETGVLRTREQGSILSSATT